MTENESVAAVEVFERTVDGRHLDPFVRNFVDHMSAAAAAEALERRDERTRAQARRKLLLELADEEHAHGWDVARQHRLFAAAGYGTASAAVAETMLSASQVRERALRDRADVELVTVTE